MPFLLIFNGNSAQGEKSLKLFFKNFHFVLHFKNICAIIIVIIAQNLLLRINSVLSALRLFLMCNAARAEDKAEFFCIRQKIGCFNAVNCLFLRWRRAKAVFAGRFRPGRRGACAVIKIVNLKEAVFARGIPLCAVYFSVHSTL